MGKHELKYKDGERLSHTSRHKKKKKKEHKRRSSSEDLSESDEGSYRSRSSKHSHRKHKNDRSPKRSLKYSESSSSSNEEVSNKSKLVRIEKKKIVDTEQLKEDRKKYKDIVKATETPEEKRARRLAKKERKERKKKEQMGWDNDYLGYTNADNPFGDEHLLDTFVWSKKLEKEGKKHFNYDQLQSLQKGKMEENKRELDKVKKRRLEREREMVERENEREQMQRDKEADYFREWEKQEDNFHLNQAKLRSQIRIQDGRAKSIDLLAKYVSAEDDDLAIEMHEPYTYLYGLTITDLEDLLEDIKVYLELEEGKNVDYWRDIIIVTEDELNKLKKLDTSNKELRDRRDGIHQSVNEDVSDIFKGKSSSQLKLLDSQIQQKMKGGEGVDVGYWESLLQQLEAHMARTRLRERHQDVLRQKLFKLKQEQGIESGPLFPSGILVDVEGQNNETDARLMMPPPKPGPSSTISASQESSVKVEPGISDAAEIAICDIPLPGAASTSVTQPQPDSSMEQPGPSGSTEQPQAVKSDDSERETSDEEDEEAQYLAEYESGRYSPPLLKPVELEYDAVIYDTVDDLKKLHLARLQVQETGSVRPDRESYFEKKAREGMNDDEAQFSVEVQLDHQAFLWSDKYRPRKPRFFNRVHTGFEWNKYNQTHYDIDNPPPKIVQGYKFNIFYPDLINKSQTPEYFVTPIEDDKDFSTLRFHAGPPYEDIAFKIVSREWEYSYKRGFRCQFQNNIFQLWFHFKRYRYRR